MLMNARQTTPGLSSSMRRPQNQFISYSVGLATGSQCRLAPAGADAGCGKFL